MFSKKSFFIFLILSVFVCSLFVVTSCSSKKEKADEMDMADKSSNNSEIEFSGDESSKESNQMAAEETETQNEDQNMAESEEAEAEAPAVKSAPAAADESGKININTAGVSQLTQLKGVGPSTAQKIIDHRTANGAFKSVYDITKVKGIGQKTFEKFKDMISVGNGSTVSQGSASSSSSSSKSSAAPKKSSYSGSLININTASVSELTKLKGVGPSTAQKIIDYREKNGAFKSTRDITKVKGIGSKTLEKFADMITVE